MTKEIFLLPAIIKIIKENTETSKKINNQMDVLIRCAEDINQEHKSDYINVLKNLMGINKKILGDTSQLIKVLDKKEEKVKKTISKKKGQ